MRMSLREHFEEVLKNFNLTGEEEFPMFIAIEGETSFKTVGCNCSSQTVVLGLLDRAKLDYTRHYIERLKED